MIEVRNLCYSFKAKEKSNLILNNINLSISNKDICAIIGPSGCGKSTLMLILAGILNDYSGEVYIDGFSINPQKQDVGLVLQSYGLLPWKKVYDNAVLGLKIKGKSIDSEKEYIDYILNELNIKELSHRFPNQLSGGQQQRVALARSFILKPKLLLMDEPFSALDAISREEAQDLFLRLWKKENVSTLFVTHSIEEALYVGSKIVILSPLPASIIRVFDNPLFGKENLRLNEEYYKLNLELRKYIKGEWSHENI